MIPSTVFVLGVALKTKFLLSSKFEKFWECAKDVYACCVNLEKAYDWISHEKFWWVSWEYDVDSRLSLAFKTLYSCSKIWVCANGVKSQPPY